MSLRSVESIFFLFPVDKGLASTVICQEHTSETDKGYCTQCPHQSFKHHRVLTALTLLLRVP